jgi:hypothetical protein
MRDQKPKHATSQVVDDSRDESYQEVKDPAEHNHLSATREGALTEGPTGYRLQDGRGAGSAAEVTVDTRVSDIQSARDQAAEQTGQKRFQRYSHVALLSRANQRLSQRLPNWGLISEKL